ncbi:MAG TPA: SGNH/GDSL hydrolase family protein [Sphingobium sp.]|uniref:SGNH/GDSL hydrolase family protein n=1 Tax=Sphingobium sp. TaxID=1912891 RepID=UPI002ECFB550
MLHKNCNVILATVLPLTLTACSTTPNVSATRSIAGAKYVAMGSSFAAGAGIGPLQVGSPARCGRTANNYATLLAQRFHMTLTDVSCGGAMTANILNPWSELPAQVDALDPETSLVTITIGGNDVGYVMGLVGGSCRANMPIPSSSCLPKPTGGEAAWRKLEQNLGEISRQVAIRAPKAKLVFIQYVTLVPPVLCEAATLLPAEAEEYRSLGRRLAEVTSRVAHTHGAMVLPIDRLSRDHTACSAAPWSHGLSAGYDMKLGAPWHPSKEGHAAIAQVLSNFLGRKLR